MAPLTGNPGHDIPTEIAHGKPRKQAVAIALSEQRRKGKDMMPSSYQDQGSVVGFGSKQLKEANEKYAAAKKATPEQLRELFQGGVRHDKQGYNWYWQLRDPHALDEDAILPVDTDTKQAIAAHNSGLTQSQDKRVKDGYKVPRETDKAWADKVREISLVRKEFAASKEGSDAERALHAKLQKLLKEKDQLAEAFMTSKKKAKDEDPDLIQPVSVEPVPMPSGEKNQRGWFRGAKDDDASDNASVLKAYEDYKRMDTANLKAIYKRSHKVSDLNGVPKSDLIADIMESEFGRKRIERAFASKKAKDTSALAPKAEQLANGARVHNSKGSVGEVVHVNGDKVIVAVAGKRQEWPLSKTFRAGGAEDATREEPHVFQAKLKKPDECRLCGGKKYDAQHAISKKIGAISLDDELLPVAEDTTYATPPKKPAPYRPFGFTAEQLKQTLAPKDPAGFARQFGKDAGHTREELEAYVKAQEARLAATSSPWMKAEVKKGIALAKAELAKLGAARDELLPVPVKGEARDSRTAPVRVRDASSGRWGAVKAAKEPGLEPVEDLNPDASERAVFASYADKAAKAKRKRAAKKAARTRKRNRAKDSDEHSSRDETAYQDAERRLARLRKEGASVHELKEAEASRDKAWNKIASPGHERTGDALGDQFKRGDRVINTRGEAGVVVRQDDNNVVVQPDRHTGSPENWHVDKTHLKGAVHAAKVGGKNVNVSIPPNWEDEARDAGLRPVAV